MANSQDHVWHILRDVLELLAGAGIPTPERGYALDGGWSLALSDLRRLVHDRNALRAQLKTAIAERDALLNELEAAREKVGALRQERDTAVYVIQINGHATDHVDQLLDARDRRMKAIGAAEELELLIGNWRNMRLEDYLPKRAAQLRQEAGDGK